MAPAVPAPADAAPKAPVPAALPKPANPAPLPKPANPAPLPKPANPAPPPFAKREVMTEAISPNWALHDENSNNGQIKWATRGTALNWRWRCPRLNFLEPFFLLRRWSFLFAAMPPEDGGIIFTKAKLCGFFRDMSFINK
jgi:hypothetical protein